MNKRRELETRTFKGQTFGNNVADWLNGTKRKFWGKTLEKNTSSSRRRILDLISCIQEILAVIEKERPWDFTIQNKRLNKLMVELNQRLAEYQLRPTFYITGCGGDGVFDNAICGRVPVGESLAAHGVIELAKQHKLDRIRSCICGRWFFARFAHQRSCSETCRHKIYERSENFKAKRREYMRAYYRVKMSGKVK